MQGQRYPVRIAPASLAARLSLCMLGALLACALLTPLARGAPPPPVATTVLSSSTLAVDPAWQRTTNWTVDGAPGNASHPSIDPYWLWSDSPWQAYTLKPEDYYLYWNHHGQDMLAYTHHWLRTRVTLPALDGIREIRLVNKYDHSFLSVNDNAYVYVNGTLAAWGGTSGGAPCDWSKAPETRGWHIPGGLVLARDAFHPGDNDVTILAEEYFAQGGLGHPVFLITADLHTLTGRVVDAGTAGIADVMLIDSAGNRVMTQSDGSYRIAGLFNGDYTIAPFKSGYAFTPVTRTVVLNGDVAGQDFQTRASKFLDLPLAGGEPRSFTDAVRAYNGQRTPGRVTSWFDHSTPDYGINLDMTTWTGDRILGGKTTDPATCERVSCYDGHNGIDFSHRHALEAEPVFAAAPGRVADVCPNYPCSRGRSYGNYVLIDHGNGYATFYAHLKSVDPSVRRGAVITDPRGRPIGIMGGTDRWPVHLHFGVYFDSNGDGQWADREEAVDPFGWEGLDYDPWAIGSSYLWKQPMRRRQWVGGAGAEISDVAEQMRAQVPEGALTDLAELELWDAPAPSPPRDLRTIGHSFWLRARQWVKGSVAPIEPDFARPITVTLSYTDEELLHLDEAQLTIAHWDSAAGGWEAVATEVDMAANQAVAHTTYAGKFDLVAPLVCPADVEEPDDAYDIAGALPANGKPVTHVFDVAGDEDWFRLRATAGSRYTVLIGGADLAVKPVLELYDVDAATALLPSSESSRIDWVAPETGIFYLRVSQAAGGTYGCSASYTLSVAQHMKIDLPLVFKNR